MVVAGVALLDRLVGLLPTVELSPLGVCGTLVVGPTSGHDIPVGKLFERMLPSLGTMLLERGADFWILQDIIPERSLLLGQLSLHGVQLSIHLRIKGHVRRVNVLGSGLGYQADSHE